MKLHRHLTLLLLLALIILGLAACGGRSSVDDEARIETRVAEELAVAATLTASAAPPVDEATATSAPPTVAPPTIAPTTAPEDTATPVVLDANDVATEPAPTATSIPPTTAPADTATPVVLGFSPTDGDDGNDFLRSSFDQNQGRVILFPGFAQSEISVPPVFRERMVLRVEVFDTRAGLVDGDGIQEVTFTIEDADGRVVHERTERTPGYCIFGGGEPNCNVLDFERENFRWPNEGEIFNGDYLVKIDIVPENGDATQWRLQFVIDTPGRDLYDEPPKMEPNTARITSISEDNGRYIVDFETVAFVPTLPGQHVHFFWNTVPPEQAGLPGSGPWQLYPASNGASGASPFTMYGVQDRPNDATQICVLVANPNHSVLQGTGNCVDLP